MPGNMKGCSRGIFALQSWEPLRKPGQKPISSGVPVQRGQPAVQHETKPVGREPKFIQPSPPRQNVAKQNDAVSNGDKSDPRVGRTMKAKYSYKANPDSPIGPELSVTQLEELQFVEACPDNDHWWVARNRQGDKGYVPASYMQLEEARASQLPWLQNKRLLEDKHQQPEAALPPEQVVYKPYRSAYDKSGEKTSSTAQDSKEYHCEICEKTLNGPYPYKAHMNSKAHKEMVDYLEEMKQ